MYKSKRLPLETKIIQKKENQTQFYLILFIFRQTCVKQVPAGKSKKDCLRQVIA